MSDVCKPIEIFGIARPIPSRSVLYTVSASIALSRQLYLVQYLNPLVASHLGESH